MKANYHELEQELSQQVARPESVILLNRGKVAGTLRVP